MSAGVRIAAFVAVLVLLFGGAALAGGAIEPHGADPKADNDDRGDQAAGDDDMGSTATHSEKGAAHGGAAPQPVRGLAVAADDLRIVSTSQSCAAAAWRTSGSASSTLGARRSVTLTSRTRSACT